ncbi:MAG: hypothetical protein MHM6MM_006572 [Cercozoa sp. M6MM]
MRIRGPLLLAASFAVASALVFAAMTQFPPLSVEERSKLRFPTNIGDIRDAHSVLHSYQETNGSAVIFAFCVAYVVLQTFAIPGPLLLSILAGALFDRLTALVLVSLCATSGASLCYLLSQHSASGLVKNYVPKKQLNYLKTQVEKRHNFDLLSFMLFLRLSPLLPNWLINVSSPHVGVPMWLFFSATFLGLIPANVVHVSTGTQLLQLTDDSVGLDMSTVALFAGFGFVLLLPTLLKDWFRQKLGMKDE